MNWRHGISVAALALLGCAYSGPTARHEPLPGYICEVPTGDSRSSARAKLLLDGQLHKQEIRLRVQWPPDGVSLSFSEDYGGRSLYPVANALLKYPILPRDLQKTPRVQLALTTVTGANAFEMAKIRGPEMSGYEPVLPLAFADLVAMSKGSSELYLLARNDRDGEVMTTELTRADIALVEQRLDALRLQLEALKSNYESRCNSVADISPLIIVTQ